MNYLVEFTITKIKSIVPFHSIYLSQRKRLISDRGMTTTQQRIQSLIRKKSELPQFKKPQGSQQNCYLCFEDLELAIHTCLTIKYSPASSYKYQRVNVIDQLLGSKSTMGTIQTKQIVYQAYELESMKKVYYSHQLQDIMKVIADYNKLHNDCPVHFADTTMAKLQCKYYNKKKQIQYNHLKKLLKAEQGISLTTLNNSSDWFPYDTQQIEVKNHRYSNLLSTFFKGQDSKDQLLKICHKIDQKLPQIQVKSSDFRVVNRQKQILETEKFTNFMRLEEQKYKRPSGLTRIRFDSLQTVDLTFKSNKENIIRKRNINCNSNGKREPAKSTQTHRLNKENAKKTEQVQGEKLMTENKQKLKSKSVKLAKSQSQKRNKINIRLVKKKEQSTLGGLVLTEATRRIMNSQRIVSIRPQQNSRRPQVIHSKSRPRIKLIPKNINSGNRGSVQSVVQLYTERSKQKRLITSQKVAQGYNSNKKLDYEKVSENITGTKTIKVTNKGGQSYKIKIDEILRDKLNIQNQKGVLGDKK